MNQEKSKNQEQIAIKEKIESYTHVFEELMQGTLEIKEGEDTFESLKQKNPDALVILDGDIKERTEFQEFLINALEKQGCPLEDINTVIDIILHNAFIKDGEG